MVLFINQVIILHSVPCVIFPIVLWGRKYFWSLFCSGRRWDSERWSEMNFSPGHTSNPLDGGPLIWTQGFLIKSSFWPQHVPSLRPGSFLASPPSHELQTDGDCVFYSHPAIPRPSAALTHEALCVWTEWDRLASLWSSPSVLPCTLSLGSLERLQADQDSNPSPVTSQQHGLGKVNFPSL